MRAPPSTGTHFSNATPADRYRDVSLPRTVSEPTSVSVSASVSETTMLSERASASDLKSAVLPSPARIIALSSSSEAVCKVEGSREVEVEVEVKVSTDDFLRNSHFADDGSEHQLKEIQQSSGGDINDDGDGNTAAVTEAAVSSWKLSVALDPEGSSPANATQLPPAATPAGGVDPRPNVTFEAPSPGLAPPHP